MTGADARPASECLKPSLRSGCNQRHHHKRYDCKSSNRAETKFAPANEDRIFGEWIVRHAHLPAKNIEVLGGMETGFSVERNLYNARIKPYKYGYWSVDALRRHASVVRRRVLQRYELFTPWRLDWFVER